MPSAPVELQERWQHSRYMDQLAWNQLAGRYHIARDGSIRHCLGTAVTADDESALLYLTLEWDFGYDFELTYEAPNFQVVPPVPV